MALDTGWLTTILLLSLRLAGVFMGTPLLAPASVPLAIRVLVVVGLAAALSLGPIASAPALAAADPGTLFQACVIELALGVTLGLGIALAFAAASVAGQLIGLEIGFGLGQVIDPASSASMPVVASAMNQVAVLVFFLADGHHALLRGLAYSIQRFPVGRPWPIDAAFGPILRQVSGLFGLGFALAAPVVFCLLLVDLALGVVARNLPQVNMIAVGIPAKVIAGMLALALWSAGMGEVMSRIYAGIYRTWEAIFLAEAHSALRGYAALVAAAASGTLAASGRAG
jgi:flagellar biosynthesis protein FliR